MCVLHCAALPQIEFVPWAELQVKRGEGCTVLRRPHIQCGTDLVADTIGLMCRYVVNNVAVLEGE
jgi:hypothetical protein